MTDRLADEVWKEALASLGAQLPTDLELKLVSHFDQLDIDYRSDLAARLGVGSADPTSSDHAIERQLHTLGSKFAPDFALNPRAALERVVAQIQTAAAQPSWDGRRARLSVSFPRQAYLNGIGWDSVIPIAALAPQERARITSGTRDGAPVSVLEVGGFSDDHRTWDCLLVLERTDAGAWVVITLFPGRAAPPLPSDRLVGERLAESRTWWTEHAFLRRPRTAAWCALNLYGVVEMDERARGGLEQAGFRAVAIDDKARDHFTSSYSPDFRRMMLLCDSTRVPTRRLRKALDLRLQTARANQATGRDAWSADFRLETLEITVFPGELALISLRFVFEPHARLSDISDVLFLTRTYDSRIRIAGTEAAFTIQSLVQSHLPSHVRLAYAGGSEDGTLDYAGPKMKAYLMLDTDQPITPVERDHLLYELGTCSQLGSASSGSNAPTPGYFAELMRGKVSVFANWEALSLFDSFTVISSGYFASRAARDTWRDTYCRIYEYNSYIKHQLSRISADVYFATSRKRTELEQFGSNFNILHISYNFLPNHINKVMRQSLDLEEELRRLRERVANITRLIEEGQKRRTNVLLGLVSVFSGVGPVLTTVEKTRQALHLSQAAFVPLAVVAGLVVSAMLAKLLFPEQTDDARVMVKRWLRTARRKDRDPDPRPESPP